MIPSRTALKIAWIAAVIVAVGAIHATWAADAVKLAARIDEHMEAAWKLAGIAPAPVADDATFLRRVSLDLIGRVPTVSEVQAFLDTAEPLRRQRAIESLLVSPLHARQMAVSWRRAWLPQIDASQFEHARRELEEWLTTRLETGDRLDSIVQQLLAVSNRSATGTTPEQLTPTAFLVANEFKPEQLAANAGRAFLGLHLDCAQCHNHPFAQWTQDQFWEMAAFFSASPGVTGPSQLEMLVPNTNRRVNARLLDETTPKWPERWGDTAARIAVAEWITAKDNSWFARNTVNLLWTQFFGTGLVESLDDASVDNPPANAKLLDELAAEFSSASFDLTYFTRAVVRSQTYQRAATLPSESAVLDSRRLFARAAVRALTGEQLYDSLLTAAGFSLPLDNTQAASGHRERDQFVAAFHVAQPATAQRSVLQSLAAMNGALTDKLTSPANSPALVSAQAPFLDREEKIQSLFMASLGRSADPSELKRLVDYYERGSAHGDASSALADIFWALLNCSEFNTNH